MAGWLEFCLALCYESAPTAVVIQFLLSVSRFVRVCRHGILVEEGSLVS